MKDFLGKELQLGDFVVFTLPSYRELTLGKVVKFTPQKIRVEYTDLLGEKDTHALDSKNSVRVDEKDATMYFLKK